MHAAALRVDLRLRGSRSLKAKRRILSSLSAALRKAFSVAYAEVDFQEQWQRSAIGLGLVSSHSFQLERNINAIRRFLEGWEQVELISMKISYLEEPL